jgi:phage/plasmid primase-like uncharacterized protein
MAILADADKAPGESAELDRNHAGTGLTRAAEAAQGKSGRKLFPPHFTTMPKSLTMA